MAISKFDQFDFLIDIVPRDELKPTKRQVSDNMTVVYHKLWFNATVNNILFILWQSVLLMEEAGVP